MVREPGVHYGAEAAPTPAGAVSAPESGSTVGQDARLEARRSQSPASGAFKTPHLSARSPQARW